MPGLLPGAAAVGTFVIGTYGLVWQASTAEEDGAWRVGAKAMIQRPYPSRSRRGMQ